ncbi:MAG: toll/interleukin-1 receptor domain-containing protein [Chloroflexi bacterium]|nr:toll/interleukin-1 receptor domain-containing protein [Chloroflexota bacterium]
MPSNRSLRVYLSCSSHDIAAAREYYQKLRAAGWIQPWLEEEDLLPGQDSRLEIEKAVRNADAVLVFLSSRSVTQEGNLQRELRLALDVADEKPEGAVFVIPVRLDDCSLPQRLRTWKPVDAFPADRRDWAYQRVLASIRLRAETVGHTSSVTPSPEAQPQPQPAPPPRGDIHVTVYGDVSGNLVVGDENRTRVTKEEKQPKE